MDQKWHARMSLEQGTKMAYPELLVSSTKSNHQQIQVIQSPKYKIVHLKKDCSITLASKILLTANTLAVGTHFF